MYCNIREKKAQGTALFKGKAYFVLWTGSRKDGCKVFLLAFRHDPVAFFVCAKHVTWKKHFSRPRLIGDLINGSPQKDTISD